MSRRRAAASAFALALALPGRPALAQPAPRCGVVRLVADANKAFAHRVHVELSAMGYLVESAPDFDPGKPLDKCVQAVVRVEASKRRTELWTADEGRAQFRATVVAEGAGPADDDTLAVRVAEDLRGYIAPLPPRSQAVSTPPPPPRPRPEATPIGPERPLTLGAALGVGLQPGGVRAGGFFMLKARYMLHPRAGVGALAGLPVAPSKVSRDAGEATLRPLMIGAEGHLRLTPSNAPLEVGLGAGVMLASIAMSGVARTPYVSTTDNVTTTLPFASTELAPRVADRVRLRAGALAGVAAPKAGVKFAGQKVADWGAPLVLLWAGASFEF